MSENGDRAAFPSAAAGGLNPLGLSKRELLAAMAMVGYTHLNPGGWTEEEIARKSVAAADALLEELEK